MKEQQLKEAAETALFQSLFNVQIDKLKADQVYPQILRCVENFAKSEIAKQYHHDVWIHVKDELPKLKVLVGELITTVENSVEVIVSDGETSWVDYFTLDEGFHKSIIKWQPIPKP